MLIDPWFEELGPGRHAAITLDRQAAEHLRGLWSRADVAALDESARETVTYLRRRDILPSEGAIDPRVAAALRDLPAAGRVDQLAASVGLCPSRLRALIKDLTGMPPTRLRMWQRLLAAVLSLPDKPIAVAAADAGFADQAHLTRTASRLIGRTPGELARILPGPRSQGQTTRRYRRPATATPRTARATSPPSELVSHSNAIG
jgi:AraC-like DNA-binding protein